MIDHEAIQAQADAHCQNSLCGKLIVLKTIQTFLKCSSELYQAFWSLSESQIFLLLEIYKPSSSTTEYVAPTLSTGLF